MAQPIKYRKPRRINVVSVLVFAALALGAYAAYQYLPLYFQKQEAYRILEETSSTFAGRRGFYLEDSRAREVLRRRMEGNLRALGIQDPEIETWIEVDGPEIRFGTVYSKWVEWPLDVIPKQEQVYEVEHTITVPR